MAENFLKKPQIIGHMEKSLDFSIFDTKWIPCSAKFIVIGSKPNGNGILKLFELNTNNSFDLIKEYEQPKISFKCGSFGASSLRKTHLAIGDFSGKLQILDIDRLNDRPVIFTASDAHSGIINCLDAIGGGTSINCGAPEIVTGGCDGIVKVWDPRQQEPVACISSTEPSSTKTNPAGGGDGDCSIVSRDCWAVAFGNSFNNDERCVCAGYDNGDVKLFDLRTMRQRWDCNVKNGVCGIEFDRRDIQMNKLCVTTLEGGLHCYDLRTQHPKLGMANVSERDAGRSLGTRGIISGTRATVWCVKHLPQNRDIFMSCGGTGSVRLWLYEYPSKRFKESSDGLNQGVAGTLQMLQATTISTQPINCFDWSPDRAGLAVCGSFDQTIRVLLTTKLNLY